MKRFLVVAALLVAGFTAASVQADHGRYRSVYSGGHHHHGSGCGSYRGGYSGYSGWSGGGYYAPAPVYGSYYGSGYYGGGGYGYGGPVYGTGMTIVRPGVSFSYWR